jgi:hypothetical protein
MERVLLKEQPKNGGGGKHRFLKGEPRPANAGRRPGSPNRITREFREAMVIAGEVAGDHLAKKLQKEGLNTEGGFVSYLVWLALHYPPVYGSLWGRCLPYVIKGDVSTTQEIVYRSQQEVRADLEKRGLPVPEMLLLPYEARAQAEVLEAETLDSQPRNGNGHG